MRVICAYEPQTGRPDCEEDLFCSKYCISRIYKTLAKWFLVWVTLTNMLGNGLIVLRVCGVDMDLAKELFRRRIA